MLLLKIYSRRILLSCFLFFMNNSYVLTVKITPGFNNSDSLITWYERATVGNSLHVRSNFWCLIMASTKLMQYLYITLFFCKWNLQKISIIVISIFCLNSQRNVLSWLLFSLVTLENIVLIMYCEINKM